jgi:hypothetical protein
MLSLLAKLSKRWIKLNKEGIGINHITYFIFEKIENVYVFPQIFNNRLLKFKSWLKSKKQMFSLYSG